ncbi:MAG: sensor histidine kinase [Vitreoscilla sp.]|nr:sensor histidine kinase [Burkholderiales bacterium]MBP6336255.1 sensor histidine kinase [Vitreoscilla sp.]MBP6674654.1 sensor histidine kinase [Vitreoscilla sp.]
MKRWVWRSLRARLLAGTLVWIVVTIVVAGWGLSSLFRQHVALQFHAELKTHLDQLAANLVVNEQGEPSLTAPLSDPRLARPYSGLYWQVDRVATRDAAAAAGVLRSRSLWDGVLSVPAPSTTEGEVRQYRTQAPDGAALGMMGRTVTLDDARGQPGPTWQLLVAADEQLMAAPMQRFNSSLWLALGLLGLGLGVAAAVQVAGGLAPLRQLRLALAAVREGRTQTLAGEFPAEVKPLVDEFNTVLAQNTEIVLRARTQAGNLAHALKTPLSVLGNATARQDGELARLVGEQVALANRQVNYHLMRARAAGAARVPGLHTPLQPVAEGLVRVMERVHASAQLELVLQPMAPQLAFRGEEQDLQEMLGNLLDNACKWARHRVELGARLQDGQLDITVADDGPGVPPERREAVFDRGTRDDEKVAGSGLGLAIVDDLARLYGGQVALAASPLGGTLARLRLPAAQ